MQWRLLLCEERPLVSAGVHGIFDDVSDIEIIAPGGGRYAVPGLADRLRPDAVLLGVTQVDDSVLSVLQDMRTNGLPRGLLMVDHDANAELVKAVHAGARGFVRTDYPAELVVRAVRDVLAGHAVLPPVLVDRLLAMVAKDRPARHVVAPPHVGLSHRTRHRAGTCPAASGSAPR